MPLYAYRGTACAHEFETHQSFSDDPLTECPECGGPVRRVFHAPPLVFKGSGWYITDSRSGSSTASTSNGSSAKTEPAKETPAATADKAAAD